MVIFAYISNKFLFHLSPTQHNNIQLPKIYISKHVLKLKIHMRFVTNIIPLFQSKLVYEGHYYGSIPIVPDLPYNEFDAVFELAVFFLKWVFQINLALISALEIHFKYHITQYMFNSESEILIGIVKGIIIKRDFKTHFNKNGHRISLKHTNKI